MFASTCRGRAVGIAAGYLADVVLGDPRRGHPVALFGRGAAALERFTYADDRWAGALHTGVLLGALSLLGVAGERAAAGRGTAWTAASTAAVTFVALGGTSLTRTGGQMADLLSADDVGGARRLLPSLCGRDPAALDADGLTRAAVESVAENTSDAHVAPLLWAAVGGLPALLVYRGANTVDAMIGHRSPRYHRFGWAAARFDDALNFVAARVTGLLVAVCAAVVGGSPAGALRAWRRDATRHPSPNAGVVEAAFAGALGVRLGGPTQYAHQLEIRPTLGDGPAPQVSDLVRAVRLSRAVQVLSAALAVLVSAACRSGRRVSLRW
ncbi:MAG: cobalamin biosynthesis protein [Mycobacterium sp.]